MSAAEIKYWVWRRHDGYIGCTKGRAAPTRGFGTLSCHDEWPDAYASLVAARDGDRVHGELVRSWEQG